MALGIGDLAYDALGSLGYSGTLNERMYKFWTVGAASVGGTTSVKAGVGSSSTNSTLTTTGASVQLVDATSGNIVKTLPTAASAVNIIYTIKKIDASVNTVTVQAAGAELIDGANTRVLTTQYQSIQIISNGTAWYIL